MNKIVALFLFLFLITFFLLGLKIYMRINQLKNNNSLAIRTLNYIPDDNIYSIIETENNFLIKATIQEKCIKTPCSPAVKQINKVIGNEDSQKLKDIFNEIFKDNNDIKEVYDEDLTEEQFETISEIFDKYNIIPKLQYEIIKDNNNNPIYSQRGVYYENQNGSPIYTIASGEKPHSGYYIEVMEVEISRNSVRIYIEEGDEGEELEILTYPIVHVKFNRIPNDLVVIDEYGLVIKDIQ